MKCGDGIKAMRFRKGLTRAALSAKSGVSTMSIRRYENLERIPRLDVLEKLATALGCTVSDFTEDRRDDCDMTTDYEDTVGDRIRQFRLNKGLSQQQLGDVIGMSQQQVGQYEKGARIPKPITLSKFAFALGCTVFDLSYNKTDIESNQGYEIIEAETYCTTDAGRQDRIVLGQMYTKYGKQFVTWESAAYSQDDRPIEYFYGHYFSDENAARADYHRRLLEKYE